MPAVNEEHYYRSSHKELRCFNHPLFEYDINSDQCMFKVDIQTLPEDEQIALLSQKDYFDFNALMFAAQYQPDALPVLLNVIQKWPKKKQMALLSQKNRVQENILMFTARHQPHAQPVILDAIHQLSLSNQAKLLCQQEFNASLNHEITSLKNTGLEGAIKQCLQAMHYNKTNKQIAILDALRELKKTHPDDTDAAIKKAVNEPDDPLYHALNIKRYPFGFFRSANSESGSLQKIKNTLNNSLNTP